MTSHTFNTVAGTTDAGGTGGGSAGITSNVITNLVADVSEGSGFVHNQVVNGGSTADCDTIMGLNYRVSGTAGLRLVATDDSKAIGTGGGATRFDYAYARGPNSSSNAQTTYNDQDGGTTTTGTYGSYEWRETSYTDGEGFTEVRLDIRWNSTVVFSQMVYTYLDSYTGSDGFLYTKGSSIEPAGGTAQDVYAVTRGNPGRTMYANNTTSGNITAIKMKVTVDSASEPAGNIAALRSLTNTAGANFNLSSTGSYDSGWLTSNLSDGLDFTVRQLPNTSTNATYIFTGSIELWARASGVSDTKVKDCRFSTSTIISGM